MRECVPFEKYLKEILILLETKGYARSKDIADRLGVTKPMVSAAMKKLKANGCITMKDRSPVYLTDKGFAIARAICDRNKTLARFLVRLGIDEQTAAADACRIEQVLSDESYAVISEWIKEK